MARDPSISQEDINAAADGIRAAGGKPTARAVREVLGGGSMATVLRHLQIWKAGQVRVPESPVVLPAGLQRALVDFIGQETAAAKADLEAELALAQQENADLISESERLSAVVDEQGRTIEALHDERSKLSGRLTQIGADLEGARAEAVAQRQAAEGARTEVAKLQLRLEGVPRLEADLAQLRTTLESEREARAKAEQAAAVAAARLEKAEAQAEEDRRRLERVELDARENAQEAARLRAVVDAARSTAGEAERKLGEAQIQATRAAEEAASLRGQLTELRATTPPPARRKDPGKPA